jgi:cytochrome c-type biogenesis protein CcmH
MKQTVTAKGAKVAQSSAKELSLRFFADPLRTLRLDLSLNQSQMKRPMLLLMLLSCLSLAVVAKEAQPSAEDPALEERVMNLSSELRCLVCQNETLADSRADLAEDLRRQIRDQMKAGKSDKEIIGFLTQRYGDFVLYRPPVRPTTYLLWFGPFCFLLVGLILLFRYVKQRRELILEQPLSAEDHRRAETLLNAEPGKETA